MVNEPPLLTKDSMKHEILMLIAYYYLLKILIKLCNLDYTYYLGKMKEYPCTLGPDLGLTGWHLDLDLDMVNGLWYTRVS